MAFNSYLVQKFNYTQENEYFRKLSVALETTFGLVAGEHILIGNVSINGHFLDAIFVANGQISIIDFKNYGGEVAFSENGPWLLETKGGKQIFVQGGGQMRNPYQQVRAYRFSLMDFLKDNEKNITEGIRTNLKWEHTSSIVLFQQKVTYEESLIPELIKPWFHIASNDSIITLLTDKYSAYLNLTDNEIKKFLKVLNITSDNLLANFALTDGVPAKVKTKVSEEKIAFIHRLIEGNSDEDLPIRLLKYYRALVQLERFKEPSANHLHKIPFSPSPGSSILNLDITINNAFNVAWQVNKQDRFPKNLFIGLEMVLNGIGRPLLFTILLQSDIQNDQNISLNLNQFELYAKELEQMGLDESVVEEITTGINSADTLEDKIKVLQTLLSPDISLSHKIIVGLSTESLFTAQLQSELNSLINLDLKKSNGIFQSFLFQENKLNGKHQFALEPFIQITPLNSSQSDAISEAFQQDITVITGPPGTGKSQVVTNILANAALNNKSVLFVSKNSKAVDNVKDRLDALLGEEFVLRFGSKENITSVTKPALQRLLNKASQNNLPDVSKKLASIKQAILILQSRRTTLESLIKRIPELQQVLTDYKRIYEVTISEREVWISTLSPECRKFFIENKITFKIDVVSVTLQVKKLELATSSFLSKIWFTLFQKSSVLAFAKQLNQSLPNLVISQVEEQAPIVSLNQTIIQSLEGNLKYILKLYEEQTTIYNKDNSYHEKLKDLQNKINATESELTQLVELEPAYQEEIKQINAELPTKGLEALRLKLADDLFHLDRNHIQEYLDYLPVKIWRNTELNAFNTVSQKFLKNFKIICVTSLSIKNAFPLQEGLFDLVVIDEASQCDLVSALPLIYRAKKAVIIGDPLQLTHITNVQDYEEEYLLEALDLQGLGKRYNNTSLYDYADSLANKSFLKTIFLKEHYRCHPEIINFSNYHFYERRLGQTMKIMTQASSFKFGQPGLNWISVQGEMLKDQNLNIKEANIALDLARKLSIDNPAASIGIITPFKDQKKYIFDKIPADLRDSIKVDTVHQFQGDEKDIIVLSLVVTQNSPQSKARFLNRNDFLINVAITRARSSLYIVGDWDYCKNLGINSSDRPPLQRLANYAFQFGKVQ